MKKMIVIIMSMLALNSLAVESAKDKITLMASDDYTPFQISVLPGVEVPFGYADVRGARFNLLAGRTRSLAYLDLGVLANLVENEARGLQICGLYNHVGTGLGILQIAGLVNLADKDCSGMQLAAIYNQTSGVFNGLSFAAINDVQDQCGLQMGLVNTSRKMKGCQFGLVNYSDDGDSGMQIGIVNIMPNAEVPVTVLFNCGFYTK